jgi:hypothetical protein
MKVLETKKKKITTKLVIVTIASMFQHVFSSFCGSTYTILLEKLGACMTADPKVMEHVITFHKHYYSYNCQPKARNPKVKASVPTHL